MDPNLSYDYLVKQEAPMYHALLQDRAVDPLQFSHRYWRRVIDGYALGDVLAEIVEGGPAGIAVVGGAGAEGFTAAPCGLTYDGFLEEQTEIAATLVEVLGAWTYGDLAHNAWRRLVEGWTQANLIRDIKGEPVDHGEPDPNCPDEGWTPGGSYPAAPGPARFDGRVWRLADGRPYLPHATHFMEMLALWVRDRGACRTQIASIADATHAAGLVPCFRFLDTLGWYSYWRGREVSPIAFVAKDGYGVPATPDYYGQLEDLLEFVRSVGGMVRWSRGDTQLFGAGSTQAQRLADHVRRGAEVLGRVGPSVLEAWHAINEGVLNGVESPAEARIYLDAWRAATGQPGAFGAPYGTEDPDELQAWANGADYGVVHSYRPADASIDEYAKVLRHIFSVRREAYGGRSGSIVIDEAEPFGTGADVWGGRTDSVELLTLGACMSQVTAQAWTYMSSNGVRWNGPIEAQPGFAEVLRATAALPADLYGWQIYRGGNRENPLAGYPGYWGDAGVAEGPARVDGATDGRRWIAIVYGGRPRYRVRAQYAIDGVVWDPATDRRDGFALNAGDVLELSYAVGRVLYGTFRSGHGRRRPGRAWRW